MNLKNLSIEEKIGQMLMFAFHGTSYNEQLDYLIKNIKVGGIIHFARNLVDPNQANTINKKMQENASTPLFIGLDQEGGTVMRITKDVTPFTGAMGLSATEKDTTELVYNVGVDLKNMNFNMVFAPVADVNNNPKNPVINSRSYSDNEEVVSKYVNYAFKGFQKAGILPTAKHFLGHGDTSVDSHISLPYVSKSISQLKKVELYPFKKAINEGIDGIMISHIMYPTLDKDNPASLSHEIMTNLLRKELNFDGLIVSDSLTMGAINNNFSKKEVILNAVNGGMDLLIFCGRATLEEQIEIFNIFKDCVSKNLISIERIDASIERIQRLKEKYATKVVDSYIYPTEEKINLGTSFSEASISLVKENKFFPLNKDDSVLVLFPKIKLFSLVDNELSDYTTLKKVFSKYDFNVSEIIVSDDLISLSEIKKNISNFTKVIYATYNVMTNDYQTKVWQILDKEKTCVVSLRSPCDIIHLGDVCNYVCVYEASDLSLNSFVKCAVGLKNFVGKIPVKLD